jgi:hypothetical protein
MYLTWRHISEDVLKTITDWRDPIDISEVNIEKIAFLSKFSESRIREALLSERSIFEGRSIEKETVRRQAAILDDVKSLEGVVRALARYRLDNQPSLDHRDTGRLLNREVENIFIWHFAHRCKLSTKSSK